jgi:glucose/mannose-6-phosphate isomerase
LIDFDDLDAIARLDSLDILSTVEAFAEKLHDAWEIGRAANELPDGLGVDSVVVLGMGGSGAGGDLVGSLVEPRLPVPFSVIRSYGPLPEWIGRNTLVFALSYSGDTEETLVAFEAAHERGARIVSLSSGGKLADRAAEVGSAHIGVPAGLQPRAASAYLTLSPLLCMSRIGLVPNIDDDVEEALTVLGELDHRCHRKSPTVENPAKDLAARLAFKLPVLYGGPGIGSAIARRFKADLNEYAKSPAFWNEIPEMNHNEIEGWRNAGGVTADFVAVWFADAGDHERVSLRWDITRGLLAAGGADLLEVSSEGASPLARLMSLLYITQLAAVYVGIAHGVDPGPVDVLEQLKREIVTREGTVE